MLIEIITESDGDVINKNATLRRGFKTHPGCEEKLDDVVCTRTDLKNGFSWRKRLSQ